ncbi:general substrate transporter, partial [Dipodascopsis uninucleata]
KSDHEETVWDACKRYPKACFWIALLLWGVVLVGYDSQAGGMVVSIPRFREDFGYYYAGNYVLVSKWQSAFSGGPLASLVFGSIGGTWISDYIGRKWTIFIGLTVSIAAVGVEFSATTNEVFFAGKFINGCGLGFIYSVSMTFIAEISPLSLRGITTGATNLSLCIGPFVCYLVSNKIATRDDAWAYRALFASQWAFSGTCFLLLPFIPESPWFYAARNQDEKAKQSLMRLYGDQYRSIDSRLNWIKTVQQEVRKTSEGASYIDCFRGTNLRRTIISCMPMIIQQMSGVNFIANYSTYYYQLAGFTTHQSYQISCGAQALSISGTLVAIVFGDRIGRRRLLILGLSVLTVLLAITGGLATQTENVQILKAASAFIAMYNFFYNAGQGAVVYSVSAECPASHLRSKTIALALGIANMLGCMWSFVLPFIFNPDNADLEGKTAFIFCAFDVLSLVYLYFYQPETANRSYAEIDEMFNNHVSARNFAKYKTQ